MGCRAERWNHDHDSSAPVPLLREHHDPQRVLLPLRQLRFRFKKRVRPVGKIQKVNLRPIRARYLTVVVPVGVNRAVAPRPPATIPICHCALDPPGPTLAAKATWSGK